MDTTAFEEQGYQVLRGVLEPDAIAQVKSLLRDEARRAIDTLCDELGAGDIPSLCQQIDAWSQDDRIERLDRDIRMQMSGHFALATRLSETLWAIPRQAALQQALRGILGSEELFMHMPPTARFVLPGNQHAGVPAHQDVSYNKHMSRFVTAWCPLVSIDERCGGVAVYEGSHKEPEQTVSQEGRFWLGGVSTDGFKVVHPRMEPGDVLVLNPFIVHASMPNSSERVRYSVDCRFFGNADTSSKHFLDMQQWVVNEPRREAG